MQLPDEAIEYSYQRLLAPLPEAWTPLAELQSQHFLSADRLDQMRTRARDRDCFPHRRPCQEVPWNRRG